MNNEIADNSVFEEDHRPAHSGNQTIPASEPLFFITPHKKWHDLDWSGMWRQRDLLRSLVLRDLRLRYRQTLLGVFWTILQPLAPMLVFTLVFRQMFASYNQGIPYAIFVYTGLIPWLFFSNAVTQSGNSLTFHSYLISKVYFPRLLLPLTPIIAGAVDFSVGCCLLFVLLIFFKIGFRLEMLFLPLLWLLTAWFALAVGVIFTALSVVYRDIRNLLPFLLQLWLFMTPIVYPSETLLENVRQLLKFNPLTGLIESYRAILLGTSPDLPALGITITVTALLSLAAVIIFSRMEKYTSDCL